ncbi:MAG: helix-turn-helix domain-containing protein [Bacteroidales bacterium]|nr:helix-turn-helix domain-containing protein [Bacteroidales bacterium]
MQQDLFHTRIRQAREQAGLTQAEMAEELGVGRTTYVAFEVGRTQLFNRQVGKMAKHLGITPEELLLGVTDEEGLLLQKADFEEWKRRTVQDYETRLAALQDKLEAANNLIAIQEDHINALNESNHYLLEQLRKND